MSIQPVFVSCYRGDELIARYEFGEPIGQLGPNPVPDEVHRDAAKTQLTNEQKAFPPYSDIRFRVERA